ncbi:MULTISPECIES: NUMOD3 domain-containing DNA-binding protein [Clostridium]|uniref:NUMOD3 domain-containing DNA-binding protein n=1 Tax=Clostridium TaxID=1485 RepID=UPI001897FB20|nr:MULTISPECIES: NUMOD3 domain-containing DNA-binding protein [Clostridium]MDI9217788.1 NUMOD3 domain-containing DNA-binding protein [Clostridium tertium]
MQRSYHKYNEENFIFTILHEIKDFKEVCELELSYLNSDEALYNISKESSGGDLISYHPNRDKIVEKMRNSSKNIWANLSEKERLERIEKVKGENNPNFKNRGKNSPLYGIPLSEEHSKKISEANKGKKLSEETRNKISEINRGRTPWNKGIQLGPLSPETKARLSKVLTGRECLEEQKPIVCEGYYFRSIRLAAKTYNVTSTAIITRIKSKTNKFSEFYYFDKTHDNINNYTIYENECNFNSNLIGITKEKKVYCEGVILTVQEALSKYNMKSSNALKYRCDSKKEKWKDFYYINQ